MSNSRKTGLVIVLMLVFPFLTEVRAQDIKAAIRLMRSEQFNAAASAYKALLKQNPADGETYYYYGENFINEYFSDTSNNSLKEISDSAKIIFQLGIQKDPANPLNLVGMGEIAMLNKDRSTAQDFFAKASALLPSKANKNIIMDPAKQANVLIRMANGYVRAGIKDTSQIFSLLKAAEKFDPRNYELFIVKGDAYIILLNDGSNAITNYNIAQSLNPQSPFAKVRIGQLWMRAKQYRNALTYYDEAIKIDSSYAPAYKERGFLLAKANRNDDAKRDFARFLKLSAGNTTARIQFVNILFDLQEYKEAINQLNEVYKVDSTNNDLNRALAYAYFETAQYDKALYFAKKFFANEKPEKIRAADYIYYGRILARNKMDEQAYEQLLKGYQLDSTKPELLSEAALCLTKTKKYDKAIETYQKKIALKKAAPMDYYNLGKVFYNVRDFQQADTNLAIFNQLQPDHIAGFVWRARTRSNIDSTSKQGFAKPIYETIIVKTQSDTAKYAKERIESFYYLAYYNFLQYAGTKNKEYAVTAIIYSNKVLAIDPKDEKADKAKQIIDNLKKFVN
ncbi:MAG: tetratricopeptide repeat protein [Bacteroidetes bacterium]|nr:tetratricopeptide repeat protein [Bacteroidota bacterium]